MTTLYNGSLTVQGLFDSVTGPEGVTTADTILSILNNIEYCSQQRVMMELGSYNTTCGNLGNIYKYALGYSNANTGVGGSFIIQGCPVSTNTYTAINPPITLFSLNTISSSLTVPLSINGSLSLYSTSLLQFNVESSGVITFKRDVWHIDTMSTNRICFTYDTVFNSLGGYYFLGNNNNYPAAFSIDPNGNVVAKGDVTAFSDIRVKENIVTIDSPLKKINSMRGVYYTRIDTPGPRHVGIIAQEVEEVLPEVVLTSGTNGNKSVAYANMVALLIEGIKEQGKQISRLEERIVSLENLNIPVQVNEDKEMDTQSNLQGMD